MSVKSIILGSMICASLVLSGCGSKQKKGAQPFPLVTALKGSVGSSKPSADSVDPAKRLTRKAIDASPVPVLFVRIETRKDHATLGKIGENRGVKTWVTADRIGLSFKHGVLVATRGLGPDLMAANVDEVLAALRSGQGKATRVHDYLNGEDQIVRQTYQCSVRTEGREALNIYGLVIQARHLVETCHNPNTMLENHYWVSGQNRIWQSRQWVGPNIKYVFSQQLSR